MHRLHLLCRKFITGEVIMENQIYREKSLKRIKSPENLNEYIKVANPGMWLGLGAIVCFLLGVLAWSAVARLDTLVRGSVVVENGTAVCYVKDSDVEEVEAGMKVRIDGIEYTLGDREGELEKLDVSDDEASYIVHAMNSEETIWAVTYGMEDIDLPDGVYSCKIVIDSVKPISFLIDNAS